MEKQIGGIVLCGGKSQRMGTSKAWLRAGDEYLLQRVVRIVAGVVDPVVVQVVHAPLENIDGAAWYGFDDGAFPREFTMVFCDGPAVRKAGRSEEIYQAWRSGVVRALGRRGMTFQTIVLDDAEDLRCPRLLDRWRESGLIAEVVETPFGRHVEARHPSTGQPGRQGGS